MTTLDPERAALIDACLVASTTEIAQAKTVVLGVIGSGPQSLEALRTAVLEAAGITRSPQRKDTVELPWPDDPDWRPDPTEPILARFRMIDAAEVALAQLAHAGVIDELGEVQNASVSVPVQRGGTGFGHRMLRPGPRLAQGYGPSRRDDLERIQLLDVDIFTADLAGLGLDSRTVRCLREALGAYRRGLFLAAVNLVGAVSEGAWFAAGERLRGTSDSMANALDNDRTTKVIELVASELASTKGVAPSDVRELQVHASYLRDLRNYGVHPRSTSSASQDQAFTDHGAGLLLMQTHRYLVRLAEAVDAAALRDSNPE